MVERVYVCPNCYHVSDYWCYGVMVYEYGYISVYEDWEVEGHDDIGYECEYYCPECRELRYYEDCLVTVRFEGNVVKIETNDASYDDDELVQALRTEFNLEGRIIYIDGELYEAIDDEDDDEWDDEEEEDEEEQLAKRIRRISLW